VHALGIDITGSTLIVGALTGLAYGLLAVGLILVYRATRIINFAHGEIGAFCALVMAKLVLDDGWSYLPALLVALVIGLALGVFWERVVIRPLRDRPRLVLLIATIGIAQVMSGAQQLLPRIRHTAPFPSGLHSVWHVAGTTLTGAQVLLLIVGPLIALALAALWRTHLGLAIRATSDNADASRLAGIPIDRLSTLVFALAGVLAAITFVLVDPVRGQSASAIGVSLGPSLLLRALIAALVGRMWSMPQAMAGGIALGMFEAVILHNATSDPGIVDVYLLALLLVLVLVRGLRGADGGSWSLAPAVAPIPRELLATSKARFASLAPYAPLVLAAVVAPFVLSRASQQFTLAEMAIYGIAGLSVVLVTGWGGQLSLAQFAFVGLGAFALPRFMGQGITFAPAMLLVSLAGAAAALVVGLPALRIRGVQLAVVTLGFAVAAGNWLFQSDLMTGGHTLIYVARPHVGGLDLGDGRTFYFVCLGVLAIFAAALHHLRHSGAGRALIAVRDNERGAEAMTIWPAAVKLSAFALAGAIAAFAGGLLGMLLGSFTAADFPPALSQTLLAMAVMGGITYVSGAASSAGFVIAIPALLGTTVTGWFGNNQGVLALLGGVGLCFFLIQEPGGLAGKLLEQRERLLRRIAPPAAPAEPGAPGAAAVAALVAPDVEAGAATADGAIEPLRVEGLTVRFGGVRADDDVSIHAGAGEIVGLIGTNGAGKSTLMNAISGFVESSAGTITLFGEDATRLSAHQRAEFGMARVFQDARLYEGLTVRETIATALEAIRPSSVTGALLWWPPAVQAEQAKDDRVQEIAAALGLTGFLDRLTSALSIGTRRVVEIACAVAAQPRLVLLDEPTAGIAQREAEAFAPVIRALRDVLGATVLIIEHDIPLVMSVCDRVYAMSAGRVIADGPPQVVRADAQVVAAYLGTDERAVQRSLHVTTPTQQTTPA
jgi:ABC-type branched-subunit amino acid transport system ATPase component/ABC-type branched-subunit amino acid transport system permease subunit